jgi:hypothetical protein
MNKRLEIEKYGVHSYDDFLCLRPPGLLIASLLFLCRGLLVFALFGLSGGVPGALQGIVDSETLWRGCLAAAPAVLVLYALFARVPTAPAFVRWIWRHGRGLMLLAALSYIALAAAQLGTDPRRWLGSGSLVAKVVVLAELGMIGYVLLSFRVRQTFLDFPTA